MGEVIWHPAMRPTVASFDKLRANCDFRRIGYHYVGRDQSTVRLFRPPHGRAFYDQWFYAAERTLELLGTEGNVVSFRPKRPQLRVVYSGGEWRILLITPAGTQTFVAKGIPVSAWIEAQLLTTQSRILSSTGVWCDVPPIEWRSRA